MDNTERVALGSPELGTRREVVLADRVGGGFRVLNIPAFVYGLARHDTIRILDEESGAFDVIRRSGEVSVRIYVKGSLESVGAEAFIETVTDLGGVFEVARNETGPNARSLLLISLPITLGLEQIATLLSRLPPDVVTWEYGNVYDNKGAPLNWWLG